MRELLNIFIAGEPLPRPRLRARPMRINGKWGAQVYLSLIQYEPKKEGTRRIRKAWDAARWRDRIMDRVKASRPAMAAVTGGIRLDVDYYFSRPGYMQSLKYPNGEIRHTGKPDVTNLNKLLEDAITDCNIVMALGQETEIPCVWKDDGQVCEGETQKWYVARDGKPGVRLVISSLVDEIEPDLFEARPKPPEKMVHPKLLIGRPGPKIEPAELAGVSGMDAEADREST